MKRFFSSVEINPIKFVKFLPVKGNFSIREQEDD